MLRFALASFVMLAGIAAASAQDFTAEQRKACSGDYDQFCKGTMPGGGRVLACLSKNRAKLSDACGKIVDAQKK